MVQSSFGPYHGLWRWYTPTKHIGVIPTPWATLPALDSGTVHGVGEHYAPPHTAFYLELCDTHNIMGNLGVNWHKRVG